MKNRIKKNMGFTENILRLRDLWETLFGNFSIWYLVILSVYKHYKNTVLRDIFVIEP